MLHSPQLWCPRNHVHVQRKGCPHAEPGDMAQLAMFVSASVLPVMFKVDSLETCKCGHHENCDIRVPLTWTPESTRLMVMYPTALKCP